MKIKLPYMFVLGILALKFPVAALGQPGYQAYYLYLGDHPIERENYWSHEAQGIAHDADHWYLTQDRHLWKIPVGNDLNGEGPGGNFRHIAIENTEIGRMGYDHFGDFECFEYDGQGYLLIPITGEGQCDAVAAFEADTLKYLDAACTDAASWAATDPDGFLYVGLNAGLVRYKVRWSLLRDSETLFLQDRTEIDLLNEDGDPIGWTHPQGGVFSTDGRLLYATTGFPDTDPAPHGIHVFDMSSRRRVQKSTNGHGHFNFEFVPEGEWEEPEGLTIWDLDDGRAPGIRGQLHVILLDNDLGCEVNDCDDVYLKHYTGTIYVDWSKRAPPWRGTPAHPYRTVSQANSIVWDGAQISIRVGSYPETLTVDKRVRLKTAGGIARIGGY